MTAYDCHVEDCPSKTLCATCAEKAPKCGHSQPRLSKLTNEKSDNKVMGEPTLKGASPTEWTFQPSGTTDVVACDGCMAHILQDVMHLVRTEQNEKCEAVLMKEHNAQVKTVFPYVASFDARGHGCINHSSKRQ